jgi:hypothetical protein
MQIAQHQSLPVRELSRRHRGLGVPGVSPEEFQAVFESWLKRQTVIEQQLNELFRRLRVQALRGVATCEKLQRYNNLAIGTYVFEAGIRKQLVDAGAQDVLGPIPPVPFPPVFADAVTERQGPQGFPTVEVTLDCGASGFPTNRMQINPPRCPTGPAGLRGVFGQAETAAAAAAAGAGIPGIGWAAILIVAIGGSIWLLSIAFQNFSRDVSTEVFNQMKLDAARETHARLLERERVADQCFEGAFQRLSPVQQTDIDLTRQLRKDCDDRAEVLIPVAETGLEPPTRFLPTLGKAVLFVGLGVLAVFAGLTVYRASRERE